MCNPLFTKLGIAFRNHLSCPTNRDTFFDFCQKGCPILPYLAQRNVDVFRKPKILRFPSVKLPFQEAGNRVQNHLSCPAKRITFQLLTKRVPDFALHSAAEFRWNLKSRILRFPTVKLTFQGAGNRVQKTLVLPSQSQHFSDFLRKGCLVLPYTAQRNVDGFWNPKYYVFPL